MKIKIVKDPKTNQRYFRFEKKAIRTDNRQPYFISELLKNIANRFSINGNIIWNINSMKNAIDDGYLINSYVYFCVNLIANSFSNIEWELFEVKDKKALKEYKSIMSKSDLSIASIFKAEIAKAKAVEKVDEHPLLDLFENPNPYQGRTEFLRELISFKYITGNGYITGYAPRSGANQGLYNQMYVMPSHYVTIKAGGYARPIESYVLELNATDEIIRPAEDVMHTKFFNPNFEHGQFLYGLSPIEAGSRPIEISNSSFETRKFSYENMGAYGILSSAAAQGMTEQEAKDVNKSYDEKYSGNKKANKIIITTGNVKWEKMGLSPVDLDIVRSNGLDKADIGLLYNIRIELMNNAESNTFANVLQAKKMLYTDTVIPAARDLADELNRWLVARFNKVQGKNYVLIPNWKNIPVLQDDFEMLHKMVVEDVKNGLLSRDEARIALGRSATNKPKMQAYTIPRNYVDIEKIDETVGTSNK